MWEPHVKFVTLLEAMFHILSVAPLPATATSCAT